MEKATELKLPVPWGHIAAKAWGSPTDYPVLCVHGILDNAAAFDRLIALLPKNLYYVSIDLPGHGFSTHFASGIPLDFFNYLLTLRYILEELKWQSFYFIGHSLGGQLGTFYSLIYPGQIKRLILIEGVAPLIIPNKNIISRIRKVHDTTIEARNEKKNRWYTRDEVMYTLTCKRNVCLNTKAAEAIFNRSVSEDGGMFKYNRDYRLRIYVIPIFNMEQSAYLLSNLNVKILFFMSTGTLDSFDFEHLTMVLDFLQNLNDSKVVFVEGNHDVHNNYPERLSHHITTFMEHEDKIMSKL
ncbi:hypothetical protein TSAR_005084 [Trichomalopsis sarcophagae]|uniref:AB hydrolase-1 domain-containing protein n=1 Tax=Trichomalopsis sarcophagae TaxID=543379 RepID=A0A232EVL5_9HYME|nr:hypothetical protein TSAR_005084 [Trichomalopsis sarcophagae]